MNRARNLGLERGATIIVPSRAYRATLEESLLGALAAGDRERVSEVRAELVTLEPPLPDAYARCDGERVSRLWGELARLTEGAA